MQQVKERPQTWGLGQDTKSGSFKGGDSLPSQDAPGNGVDGRVKSLVVLRGSLGNSFPGMPDLCPLGPGHGE